MGLGGAGHCAQLSHGRHQGNSARYDGSTRLQVGHWYLRHLMVSKTPRWGCGCGGVCAAFRPPPSRPSTEEVLRWLHYCRRLSNGSRQEGPEGKKQIAGPRLGPHRPLKSMRSQTGYEGVPEWGTIWGTVQPPTGSLGCSERKLATTTKTMTATFSDSHSVTHTPRKALWQRPFTEAHRRREARSIRVTF